MCHRHEAEPGVIASAIVRAAALHAGGVAAERADALQLKPATGTLVEMPWRNAVARQREIVRALFPGQAQVGACLFPLTPMRIDPLPPHPVLREQMREFVAKSAIDLFIAEDREPRVQRDQVATRKCHTRRISQPGIPSKHQFAGQGGSTGVAKEF